MPLVTVNVWEEVLDIATETALIDRMTEAVVEVLGEPARRFVTVIVNGVPQRRWGTGGVPASVAEPVGLTTTDRVNA